MHINCPQNYYILLTRNFKENQKYIKEDIHNKRYFLVPRQDDTNRYIEF